MSQGFNGFSGSHRRAVLRVTHEVDQSGRVIQVQLEPLPDAAGDDACWAAWQAARRCHPWIIGDDAAAKLEAAKTIALAQVNHLMDAAGEVLMLQSGIEHTAVDRLREAMIDLRGCLPALHGHLPTINNTQQRIWRSA